MSASKKTRAAGAEAEVGQYANATDGIVANAGAGIVAVRLLGIGAGGLRDYGTAQVTLAGLQGSGSLKSRMCT